MELPSSTAMMSSMRSNQDGFFCSSMFFVSFLFCVPFEVEAGIVATEAHRVGHGDVDSGLPCLVRNIVEIAFWVGMMQIDGWWNDVRQNGLDRDDGFDG